MAGQRREAALYDVGQRGVGVSSSVAAGGCGSTGQELGVAAGVAGARVRRGRRCRRTEEELTGRLELDVGGELWRRSCWSSRAEFGQWRAQAELGEEETRELGMVVGLERGWRARDGGGRGRGEGSLTSTRWRAQASGVAAGKGGRRTASLGGGELVGCSSWRGWAVERGVCDGRRGCWRARRRWRWGGQMEELEEVAGVAGLRRGDDEGRRALLEARRACGSGGGAAGGG